MGTKNNPGDFDCYGAAHPDEPLFILRGRDEKAPFVVRVWVDEYLAEKKKGADGLTTKQHAKVAEALSCAVAMDKWRAEFRGAPNAEDLNLLNGTCDRMENPLLTDNQHNALLSLLKNKPYSEHLTYEGREYFKDGGLWVVAWRGVDFDSGNSLGGYRAPEVD